MADVRSDEEEASALKNLREDLTFRYPEFSKNDQLYLTDYPKFLQTFPAGSVDSFGGKNNPNDTSSSIMIDEIQAGAQRFHAPNQWPSKAKLPNFQPIIQVYFDEMAKLAQQLFALFLKVLDQENHCGKSNHHRIRYDTPMSSFNLVRYPPSNDENGGLGISDHTDWELFTLLYPSLVKGQVPESLPKKSQN